MDPVFLYDVCLEDGSGAGVRPPQFHTKIGTDSLENNNNQGPDFAGRHGHLFAL